MSVPDADSVPDKRPVVLLFFRGFSVAYEANGPTQSLRRLIEALGDRYRFRVVTIAAPDEHQPGWGQAFGSERFAVRKGLGGLASQWRLLRGTRYDLAVHNSFFDPQLTIFVLLLRKLRLIPRRPTIIAPRGEFNPGALSLKAPRKAVYLRFARALGLLKGVHIQATDETEAATIRRGLPEAASIVIAPNIRAIEPCPTHRPRAAGEPLRIAFLSRIDPMKNLDLALRLLAQSGAAVRFDIIGPTYNPDYWTRCRKLIDQMPPTVPVRYLGPVRPEQVIASLAGYDLMLLPTAGENYGHAIVDSLLAGTPALISERTPWRGLAAACAGADIPIEDEPAWLEWIRRFAAMPPEELAEWRSGARAFIETALDVDKDRETAARQLAYAIEKSA